MAHSLGNSQNKKAEQRDTRAVMCGTDVGLLRIVAQNSTSVELRALAEKRLGEILNNLRIAPR